MFQKLRTDLVKKLAGIRLVLVNANGFGQGQENGNGSLPDGKYISLLKESGVEFVAFSKSKSVAASSIAESLGIELREGVTEALGLYDALKSELGIADKDVAFVSGDESDILLIARAGFSAARPEAPLHVKSRSYFVTYHSGGPAIGEIASLIYAAKKHPGGWSE
jgi:3-deoxy-D-manno-octulosonate 8-phosphate phosphatase (KDO 8-P phosphatase)